MQWSATRKGLLLGGINALAVAIGFAIMVGTGHRIGWGVIMMGGSPDAAETFTLITLLGMIPALLAGAAVGHLADGLEHKRPFMRFAMLSAFALFFLVLYGVVSRWPELIGLSCIPTLVNASILERWTRPVESVPIASLRA